MKLSEMAEHLVRQAPALSEAFMRDTSPLNAILLIPESGSKVRVALQQDFMVDMATSDPEKVVAGVYNYLKGFTERAVLSALGERKSNTVVSNSRAPLFGKWKAAQMGEKVKYTWEVGFDCAPNDL